MKKIFLTIIFLMIVLSIVSGVNGAPRYGGSCAYCGWFFVFGDTKPFDDCFKRMDNCFKKSKRMPGQSVNSCMCMAMRDLLGKYNKWDLLQRNLGWLYGAAGSAAGVGLPGAGLINPDEREKFTSGKASFGDYIDQLGEFGGRWGEVGSGISHAVEDSDKSAWERIVGATAAVLPEGKGKTAASFINAAASLK